jgi:hypothetical protein
LQDRIHEHADEFLDLMASDDAIFYFCGLKRMYSSVLEMLEVKRLLVLQLIFEKVGYMWVQSRLLGVICVPE